MDTGGASSAKRQLGNLRVLPVQSPQIGPEYSNKSAPEEKAQFAKNPGANWGKATRVGTFLVARGGGCEQVGTDTPAPDAGAGDSSVGDSKKKNKTREGFEMRTTEPAGASSSGAPAFTFLNISFTFRATLRQTLVTCARETLVRRAPRNWVFGKQPAPRKRYQAELTSA